MNRRNLAISAGLLALSGCSTFKAVEADVASITISPAVLTEIYGIIKGIAEVSLDVATGNVLGAIVTGIETVDTAIATNDSGTALASLLQILTDSAPYITAVANKV